MARVGVFGGSFNPIHFGHLLLADEVAEVLGLERVVFVPAGRPPHKAAADLASAADRLAMARLAVDGHPGFDVCDAEVRRTGPSYTVDTLASFGDRQAELHLIIGSETFVDLLSWREPIEVTRLARLVVVPRSGTGFDPGAPAARKVASALGLPPFERVACEGPRPGEPGRAPLLVAAASLPISASDLRRRAREGRSLAYRMPEAVIRYVQEHRLYRGGR